MSEPAAQGRSWGLIGVLLLAALLNAATWMGLGMGAAVLWHSISAFFLMQTYTAGILPLMVAGALLLTALLLAFKSQKLASAAGFLAMLALAVMIPRMGGASVLSPFVHPMQLVHWGAAALTIVGCIWLFVTTNRVVLPHT